MRPDHLLGTGVRAALSGGTLHSGGWYSDPSTHRNFLVYGEPFSAALVAIVCRLALLFCGEPASFKDHSADYYLS